MKIEKIEKIVSYNLNLEEEELDCIIEALLCCKEGMLCTTEFRQQCFALSSDILSEKDK